VRAGLHVSIASLLYLPLLYWLGPRDVRYLIALAGLIALNGSFGLRMLGHARPRTEILLLMNTLVVGLVAHSFGPIFVAPGLAAVIAMVMVLMPRYSRFFSSMAVVALMSAACLVPLVLERIGVISRTLFVTAHGLSIDAPALGGRELPTIVVGAVYTVALIIGAALASESLRVQTRAAHVRLHLQAWQLRQLVPVSK
jgi:hypothetical protein